MIYTSVLWKKNLLEEKLKKGLTLKQLSKELKSSKTNIRFWIKKFGLKLHRGPFGKLPKNYQLLRKCSCGETNPSKFYGQKRTICSKCHNEYNLKKGKKKREYILKKLGSKCSNPECRFDKYQSALDVHHLNPDIKDTGYAHHRYWSYERIDKEISKCILLCRNCHQAHHCGELKFEDKV